MISTVYIVKAQLNSRIIGGSYPQIVGTKSKELLEENGKYDSNSQFSSVPNEGYSAQIGKTSKLTDFLSSFLTDHSPIVSNELIEILIRYKLPKHRIIPIDIYRDKVLVKEKKYNIIHFYESDVQNVNFKLSTFEFYSGAAGVALDNSILQFDNYEDHQTKAKKDNRIYLSTIKKIVMKPSTQKNLFLVSELGIKMYIDGHLKLAFEKAKISGFNLVEAGYIERTT